LWPESSEEHLPINIAVVLRLRAISRSLSTKLHGASLNDGFAWDLKTVRLGVQKHEQIEKVRGSPNDTRGGSGSATHSSQNQKKA
jgi:hypothetical protein